MQGTLRRLGDRFGFFETEQGEVFVLRSDLSPDARNGDRYEFDTEDRGGRCPDAVNLRFLERPARAPQAQDQARTRDRTTTPRERGQPLIVTWSIGTPRLDFFPDPSDPDQEEERMELPVALLVKRERGGVAIGATVTLKCDGKPVYENVTVDSTGVATLPVLLDIDVTRALFTATIRDHGRDTISQQRWAKEEQESANGVRCKHLRARWLATGADGFTSVRLLATTADEKTAVTVEIEADSARVLELRVEGTPHEGPFTLHHGHGLVEVRVKDPKVAASVVFCVATDPSVATDAQILEPWEPPKTKKVKRIKWDLVHGRPGYRNTLCVESLAETADDAQRIQARLAIEYPDEIIVEIDGHEQRGRRVEFDTDAAGTRMVRIVFINPSHYGDVNIVSHDRSVVTKVFVRHPLSASKPA